MKCKPKLDFDNPKRLIQLTSMTLKLTGRHCKNDSLSNRN